MTSPELPSPTFCLGVIILAAGASTRMGQPKLLLPWGKTSVLGHLIAQWQGLRADQIAVVCARGDQALERELARLAFPEKNCIRNPAPQLGMFSSIQCASRWPGWNTRLNHWVITLGDQPHLRPATLAALLRLGTAHAEKVCQLSRQGRPRHPVLLPAKVFQKLPHATDENLKQFLQHSAPGLALEESEDAGLDLDMDQPEDYQRALRLCLFLILLLLPFTGPAATNEAAQTPPYSGSKPTQAVPLVQIRGKVVCLAEEMHQFYQAALPTKHDHLYGFKAEGGKYYALLRNQFSEALFADERFRQKELLLKGRILPGTQVFEPAVIRSIRDGIINDLYYYCEICDIQTIAPGPCECCQGPTELVEKPLLHLAD